ncbi:MAG: lamin tail domain-containing protein [Pirellulales bacterium]
MRFATTRFAALAFAICCSASPAVAQLSTLRITEAMSSSGVGGTGDWWEVTNYGSSAVDITGWKFDDSSFLFANSVALNGITTVNAGESVAFLETTTLDSGTVATVLASFRTFWGGSGTSAQVGYYSGSGIGLSSAGDGIVLYNGTGAETTPRVTFGAATTGSSFYYSYDAAGNPTTSPNTNAILSTVGTLDGQVTFNSAVSSPQNIGSPGTAVAVPEPSSMAFAAAGLGLAAAAGIRRGRRRWPSRQ